MSPMWVLLCTNSTSSVKIQEETEWFRWDPVGVLAEHPHSTVRSHVSCILPHLAVHRDSQRLCPRAGYPEKRCPQWLAKRRVNSCWMIDR